MKPLIGFVLMTIGGAAFAEPISAAVTSLLSSGVGSALAGGIGGMLLSGMMKKPDAPKATVMPTSDDKAVQDAKRRQVAEMQARSGRASTILSDTGGDKLGG